MALVFLIIFISTAALLPLTEQRRGLVRF